MAVGPQKGAWLSWFRERSKGEPIYVLHYEKVQSIHCFDRISSFDQIDLIPGLWQEPVTRRCIMCLTRTHPNATHHGRSTAADSGDSFHASFHTYVRSGKLSCGHPLFCFISPCRFANLKSLGVLPRLSRLTFSSTSAERFQRTDSSAYPTSSATIPAFA